MQLRYKILLILIACAASFFAGRLTTNTKETVKYVKGETITRTVEVPKYISSIVPVNPVLPVKKDTINSIIVQSVDTSKIIENYISERRYDLNVFDNEYGRLDVKQTLQYNELQKFDYSFTPIQKTITRERERVIVPFASASYNTFGIAGAGGGLFYRNVGIEYKYLYNVNNTETGHEFGIKVKF